MNILIPDSWLREHLKTKATPKQLKECLSLCGPSVERVNAVGKEIVYDIEVTTNRVDSMSVVGIAREAAAILPRFGIGAELVGDPYQEKIRNSKFEIRNKAKYSLKITSDPMLNPRFTAVVIDNVCIKKSPEWLAKRLELTGIRSINNIVDVTNYIMRLYGQPVHAFDFDQIKGGVMIVRAAKKGEKVTTLDGKTHALPGGDIIIEDGDGRIVDLCGIMGAHNSAVTEKTERIVLFMQTYDPVQIRKTSMALAHRSEASGLFEKGIDAELVMPAMMKGVELIRETAGGVVASRLYDVYHRPYTPYDVSVSRKLTSAYLGLILPDSDIGDILTSLGFRVKLTSDDTTVTVPSWRPDATIGVDIIEELARLYGYHNVQSRLPESEPPVVAPDPQLALEADLKVRLRDWGYTELYTYSMISEEQMQQFQLDPKRAYRISNELSSEWMYMRPSLLPSVLLTVKDNLRVRDSHRLFELSMVYDFRPHDLPHERSMLLVVETGERFYQLKGLAETVCELYGIAWQPEAGKHAHFHPERQLSMKQLGVVGEIDPTLLSQLGIHQRATALLLDIEALQKLRETKRSYVPIPKYPQAIEDIAFVVPERFEVEKLLELVRGIDPLVVSVSLLDTHEQTRTVRVAYQSLAKNLIAEDIRPVREKILRQAESKLGVVLKT